MNRCFLKKIEDLLNSCGKLEELCLYSCRSWDSYESDLICLLIDKKILECAAHTKMVISEHDRGKRTYMACKLELGENIL